ncbi:MAG: prolipoprotein diacylglyceryl transferase [Bdellovibrionales bacterium]|nr:prolipoprotein diacylglyceryl transferase [Bdellovibrionales bacterium]
MNSHYVHDIDPIIFDFGSLQIRWYGLMYVIGFIIAGYLLRVLVKKNFFKVTEDKVDSLVTTMIICMFIGARFFYVFIYNWDYYSKNLIELLSVWKGGLSFHGALVGLCVGGFIFARQNKRSFYEVMDSVALAGTQGIFFGRLGNFINGELFGRPTISWVGVIFPNGGGITPRHASQLYEAFLEGLLLTLILWLVKSKVKIYGIIGAIFVGGYGIFRFIVEFFREPDTQLGYYFGFLTMGQLLCALMVVAGIGLAVHAKKLKLTI